jgi:AraC family transcriptional regulator
MNHTHEEDQRTTPSWVLILREMLHDDPSQEWTLVSLAKIAGVHPVHLSRQFPKYFGANLGTYIRTLKVQKALSLLADKHVSLTDIAYDCGFADQSHFTRCFKAINGSKPFTFRSLISR